MEMVTVSLFSFAITGHYQTGSPGRNWVFTRAAVRTWSWL